MNGYCLDIFVINNGYKVDLTTLSNELLDELRECIYEFISDTTKLNMDCNKDFPNGLLSFMKLDEYKLLLNRVLHISPPNNLWKNTVLFFKKPVSEEAGKIQKVLEAIEDKVSYEDPLVSPKSNFHQSEYVRKNLKQVSILKFVKKS